MPLITALVELPASRYLIGKLLLRR